MANSFGIVVGITRLSTDASTEPSSEDSTPVWAAGYPPSFATLYGQARQGVASNPHILRGLAERINAGRTVQEDEHGAPSRTKTSNISVHNPAGTDNDRSEHPVTAPSKYLSDFSALAQRCREFGGGLPEFLNTDPVKSLAWPDDVIEQWLYDHST